MISRRSLITGLATVLAAPAIVRAGSLMPVKMWADEVMRDAIMPIPYKDFIDPAFVAEMLDAIQRDSRAFTALDLLS